MILYSILTPLGSGLYNILMKQENLTIGRQGETNVINKLISGSFEVKDYTDYELHKYKQHKGYDIEVLNPITQEWDRVDIKTNVKNNFLYLEAYQNPKLGWFWTSSSDYIYHYDLKKDDLYSYELKKMRNYIHENGIEPKHGREKNLIGLRVDTDKIIKKIL